MGVRTDIDSVNTSVILCVARRSLLHAHHSTWETAMRTLLVSAAFGMGALLSQSVYAADAPAAAHTALCKDGSYYDGAAHKGACRGHQGVKDWLDGTAKADSTAAATPAATDDTGKKKGKKKKDTAAATAAAPATASAPAAAPAPAATPAPAPAPAPAPTSTTAPKEHKAPTPASQIAQKPGGGAGLVWVNSESKVYHCQGDEWYGKTKQGSYMSVADAEKAGAHASHGTACK